jgi:dephospho-CoA kinase
LPDGSLDRKALGRLVFTDKRSRLALEKLLHPLIIAEQDRLMDEAERRDSHGVAIVDAALMIESGTHERFDALVVVHCDPEVQIDRLMKRDGFSREEALKRINAQMPQEEKLTYADYKIDTSGSLDDVRAQVGVIWGEISQRTQVRCP